MLRWLFNGLEEKMPNDPFPGYYEAWTLHFCKDYRSTSTIDHHAASHRAFNEPASGSMLAVTLPMFN